MKEKIVLLSERIQRRLRELKASSDKAILNSIIENTLNDISLMGMMIGGMAFDESREEHKLLLEITAEYSKILTEKITEGR